MAYKDFTLDLLESKFGIKNLKGNLFDDLKPVFPSKNLIDILKEAKELPIRSEKAKSESIVFPILLELRRLNDKFFTIYSGDNLDVDLKNGLRGECDFILAKDTGSFSINYPIIQLVEAKRNDIELGIPQCAAQLLGAKKYNEGKNVLIEKIYGCVTTGDEWLFMVLNKDLVIDSKKFYLNELENVLGAFQTIINYYKQNNQLK